MEAPPPTGQVEGATSEAKPTTGSAAADATTADAAPAGDLTTAAAAADAPTASPTDPSPPPSDSDGASPPPPAPVSDGHEVAERPDVSPPAASNGRETAETKPDGVAAATAASPTVDAKKLAILRQRVTNMFLRYAPDKLHKADEGLERYVGSEEAFLRALVKRFGPEPSEKELLALHDGEEATAARGHRQQPHHVPRDQKTRSPTRRDDDRNTSAQKAPPSSAPRETLVMEGPGASAPRQRRVERADEAMTAAFVRVNHFVAHRDRLEERQVAVRDELDIAERLERQRLLVAERSDRRSCALAESRRCLAADLAAGRERMRAELAAAAFRRAEEERRADLEHRIRALAEREARERVALMEDERREMRPIAFAATQSLSAVYKNAVRREREMRQRHAKALEEGVDGSLGKPPAPAAAATPPAEAPATATGATAAASSQDQESVERLRKFKAAQAKQREIIADRAARRREKRQKEREAAAAAERTVKSFLTDVRKARAHRDEESTKALRAAVAEQNSARRKRHEESGAQVGGISYSYLGRAVPGRSASSTATRLPPIDGHKHRAKSSLN